MKGKRKVKVKVKGKMLDKESKYRSQNNERQINKNNKGMICEFKIEHLALKGFPKKKGIEVDKFNDIKAEQIGYDYEQGKLVKIMGKNGEEEYVKAAQLDFDFYRRELLRCTTERASWSDRRTIEKAAIKVMNKAQRSEKILLDKHEFEIIKKALENYKAVDEQFTSARINSRGLLAVIDYAGKIYRGKNGGKRAAIKMGWTQGKRPKKIPYDAMLFDYILLMSNRENTMQNRNEVAEILHRKHGMHSLDSTKKALQRARKMFKNKNDNYPHIIMPGDKSS